MVTLFGTDGVRGVYPYIRLDDYRRFIRRALRIRR